MWHSGAVCQAAGAPERWLLGAGWAGSRVHHVRLQLGAPSGGGTSGS